MAASDVRGARVREGAGVSEVVQMTVDGGVALLTLNRPQRLNAWTDENVAAAVSQRLLL